MQRWKAKVDGAIPGSPVVSADGTVYVGTANGAVYAVAPDGNVRWSASANGAVRSTPAIGGDGTVYVAVDSTGILALTPDGSTKWTADDVGNPDISSPVIASDGTIYFETSAGALVALAPDGTTRWGTYPASSTYGQASPAIAPDGTVVFVANGTGPVVVGVDPKDGTTRWTGSIPAVVGGVHYAHVEASAAVASDGTVLIGGIAGTDGGLFAFKDGQLSWTYAPPAGAGDVYSTPAVRTDGSLVVGFHGSAGLTSLSATGEKVWSRGSQIDSDAAIDAKGTIYVGSGGGVLAFHADGSDAWATPTGGAVGSGIAIGADGTIYAGAADGYLYAFGAP